MCIQHYPRPFSMAGRMLTHFKYGIVIVYIQFILTASMFTERVVYLPLLGNYQLLTFQTRMALLYG